MLPSIVFELYVCHDCAKLGFVNVQGVLDIMYRAYDHFMCFALSLYYLGMCPCVISMSGYPVLSVLCLWYPRPWLLPFGVLHFLPQIQLPAYGLLADL